MTERNNFADKVQGLRAEYPERYAGDALAALDQAEAQRRERVAAALKRKHERDRDFEGTLPEELWGEEGAQLCADFLNLMAEHDYPDSETLAHRVPFNPHFHDHRAVWWNRWFLKRGEEHKESKEYHNTPWRKVRGYPIGVVGKRSPDVDHRPTVRVPEDESARYPWQRIQLASVDAQGDLRNVYLCEDGMIRVQTIHEGEGVAYPISIPDPKKNGEIPKRSNALRMDDARTLTTLPVDNNGETVMPYIGVELKVPKERQRFQFPGAVQLQIAPLEEMLAHIAAEALNAKAEREAREASS